MKNIAAIGALLLVSSSAFSGDAWVDGHTRKDGTYVAGHHRSTPDNTTSNNYSTRGNTNPYTGQQGTVDPFKPQEPRAFQPQQSDPFQPSSQQRQNCSKDLYGNVNCY